MTFDISQFELKETSVLTVQNAAGTGDLLVEGKPVLITLHGSGSVKYIQALHKADNAQTMRNYAGMRGKNIKDASEAIEQENIEKLVSCTEHIENFPIKDGARALYSNPKLSYIKKQVVRFLDDDANFTPSSTQS